MTVDLVILSNGPGEVATWVRPVVKALREELGEDRSQVRISVILSPCPHSTGKEDAIALSFPEVDRVQSADSFTRFLLWGQTRDNWDWRNRGVVLFLGGDQFFALLIGKHLGYRTIVYAEWEARWYRWLDSFAVMNSRVMAKVPERYRYKFTVVGDLIADVAVEETVEKECLIGLLPGSKPAKLMQGVPLCIAIAERVQILQPKVKFIIPVAPTLDLETLASYGNSENNYLIPQLGGISGKLVRDEQEINKFYLLTSGGTKIELITQFPAYNFLRKCQLCVTTVGANTAELGSLAIPMLVLLPTQQLDAMRSWDGLPGILANLPGVGSVFAKVINWLVLRKKRLFAWPNIWAKEEIVPELVGKLDPSEIAEQIVNYLQHPEQLKDISDRLKAVRGKPGAGKKIVALINRLVELEGRM